MPKKTDLSKDARVFKEIQRLDEIFKNMPEDEHAICQGVIVQAARLRIMLDDMWADICENGDTEQFSQSERTEPYERERPVARLFNNRDKNYQQIIKQLCDLSPGAPVEGSKLMTAVVGGRR